MIASEAWQGISISPLLAGDFLSGGGRLGSAIRAFDWASTPLGPCDAWPPSLKSISHLVVTSKQPMCFWWGPHLTKIYNDAYVPILGARADRALGRPFKDVWPDVWPDVLPLVRRALAGEGTWNEDMPLLMTRNGYSEQTYWTFSYSPLCDDAGRIAGLLNIVTETTGAVNGRATQARHAAASDTRFAGAQRHIAAQRVLEEEQHVLQRELSHRMKNTLAMVQAIVSQSLRHAESLQQASDTIAGRLMVLSRAQDILTATDWISAEVEAVVEHAVAPHRDEDARFTIAGPPARMSARQALGLSLAVHELATNAAKYGALSNDSGSVSIGWTVNEAKDFRFVWHEAGGPAVAPPGHSGFGSRLTQRIVAEYFSGRARIDYDTAGVVFTLEGRLAADEAMEEAGTLPNRAR